MSFRLALSQFVISTKRSAWRNLTLLYLRHPEPLSITRRVEGCPHYNKDMFRQAQHDVIWECLPTPLVPLPRRGPARYCVIPSRAGKNEVRHGNSPRESCYVQVRLKPHPNVPRCLRGLASIDCVERVRLSMTLRRNHVVPPPREGVLFCCPSRKRGKVPEQREGERGTIFLLSLKGKVARKRRKGSRKTPQSPAVPAPLQGRQENKEPLPYPPPNLLGGGKKKPLTKSPLSVTIEMRQQ